MKTFWIGGFPTKNDIARIKLFQDSLDIDGGEIPRDGYHVTLKYWEGMPELKDDVVAWLGENEGLFSSLRASTSKLDRFGEGKDVLVARFDSSGLQRVFEAIETGLSELGVPKSTYRTYKPHLTLAENVKRIPANDLDLLKTITFDYWELTDENREVLWSKGSSPKLATWLMRNCRFARRH